jgi:glutaconate CoA-transferase subunit A
MKQMNAALGSAEGTANYLHDYIESYTDLDGYLDLIGREQIAQLSGGATGFLLDPYRRWILSHAQTQDLLGTRAAAGERA